MKVLGINGSPRIGGNTDTLLDRVLQGAKSKGAETEKIMLNNLKFSPCQECENTKDDGSCIVKDDMQGVYRKIRDADVIVLASPIFFGSLSAQTKMMIDRFQCAWKAKYVIGKEVYRRKKAAFISTEGTKREDFFENAKSIARHFFSVINADFKEELLCSGADQKGSVSKRPECLSEAFELGKRLA